MARSDGRYKCSIKGCRNYISKGTLRSTCLRPDSSTETAATPAPEPVAEAFSPAADKAIEESVALDNAAKPGDTYQDPVFGEVHVPAPEFESSTPLAVDDKVEIAGKVETVSETDTESTLRAPRAKSETFDADAVVRLYNTGQKVVDIAVAMGYPRGHGQNRVTTVLRKAGVYKAKP